MDERGDVHTALAEMERKLAELQRELTGEGTEEGAARPDLYAAPPPLPADVGSPPSAAPPAPAPASLPPAAAPPPPAALPFPAAEAHLRAGPFADIESLGRFEQALRELDGVEEVLLRGFEGDRALFDVRLAARR